MVDCQAKITELPDSEHQMKMVEIEKCRVRWRASKIGFLTIPYLFTFIPPNVKIVPGKAYICSSYN